MAARSGTCSTSGACDLPPTSFSGSLKFEFHHCCRHAVLLVLSARTSMQRTAQTARYTCTWTLDLVIPTPTFNPPPIHVTCCGGMSGAPASPFDAPHVWCRPFKGCSCSMRKEYMCVELFIPAVLGCFVVGPAQVSPGPSQPGSPSCPI